MFPRLLNREKAAAYCGLCANSFTTHIEPHLAVIEIGNKRLWDVRAIDEWIDRRHAPVQTGERWVVEPPRDRSHKGRQARTR